jgi:HK97 family phage major capsid protein
MDKMTMSEIADALSAKQKEAKAIFDRLAVEGPEADKSRPPTDEELRSIKSLNEECMKLEEEFQRRKTLDDAKSTMQRVTEMLKAPAQAIPGAAGSCVASKSLVDVALENEEFASWYKSVQRGTYKGFQGLELNVKNLINIANSDSAGELTVPMQTGIVDNPFMRRLVLRDLVTVSPCDSDSYEYVRVTGFTNNAAEVAEATSIAGDSGRKPTSSLEFERVQEHIQDVAHLLHTTNKALADAGELRTLLDVFARHGVDSRVDYQIIRGNGNAPNLEGVLNTPNVQTEPFATDIVETALRAQTAVTLDFDDIDGDSGGASEPTAYVMNPLDWQEFLLFRDEENRFFWGGPAMIGPRMLWGLPVVTTQSVPRGRPIVADWRFARLWDRGQLRVDFFDQNRDYAERNMVLVRAERRVGFGLVRPEAFVEFEMSAGSGS